MEEVRKKLVERKKLEMLYASRQIGFISNANPECFVAATQNPVLGL